MLSKSLVASNELIPGEIMLKYYLTEENEKYGIEIEKECIEKESKLIPYIMGTKDDILELINKLAVNTVTPITLEYIIDDMNLM